jgi:hypothetical protein
MGEAVDVCCCPKRTSGRFGARSASEPRAGIVEVTQVTPAKEPFQEIAFAPHLLSFVSPPSPAPLNRLNGCAPVTSSCLSSCSGACNERADRELRGPDRPRLEQLDPTSPTCARLASTQQITCSACIKGFSRPWLQAWLHFRARGWGRMARFPDSRRSAEMPNFDFQISSRLEALRRTSSVHRRASSLCAVLRLGASDNPRLSKRLLGGSSTGSVIFEVSTPRQLRHAARQT